MGDDAELQRIIVTGEQRTVGQSSAASSPAVAGAGATPFVRATGWLPLDAAGRTTLVSVLAGACALALVALAGRELARPWLPRPGSPGAAAAVALGVSHTFWLLAVRPAVYTLSMARGAGTWATLCWRRTGARPGWLGARRGRLALTKSRPGPAAGGLAALALSVPPGHRRRLRWGRGSPGSDRAGDRTALGGAPLGDLARVVEGYRPSCPPAGSLATPLYLLYQFPLTWPLGVWGALALWREDRGALSGLLLLYAGNVLLILLHHPRGIALRDRFLFFLPSYLPVALLLGSGARRCWTGSCAGAGGGCDLALALAPLLLYPLAARVGGALASRLSPARQLPGRDPVPTTSSRRRGATGGPGRREGGRWPLAPGAVLADWLPYQTLRYLQGVEGRRRTCCWRTSTPGRGAAGVPPGARREAPPVPRGRAPAPYYDLAEIERCFALRPEGRSTGWRAARGRRAGRGSRRGAERASGAGRRIRGGRLTFQKR